MDFRDTPEQAAFRQQVRDFLTGELPAGWGSPDFHLPFAERMAFYREWAKKLGRKGWMAPAWPREYGGAGMSIMEQFIFNEEVAKARAPAVGGIGVNFAGPTIILYGTEEQKQEHLPPILAGDVVWCQGFSEPGAGSDLASLQTRAVRDGDDYIINGQKTWTSGAQFSHKMILLARTDPQAPKHKGISYFLLDMNSPGITIQPLVNIAGVPGFNEVFFDNVRIPSRNLLGEENRGWYIGTATLDFERSSIGAAWATAQGVEDLARYAREHLDGERGSALLRNPTVRWELAERSIEAEVARLLSYRVVSLQSRGLVPNYEASIAKLYTSELQQRIAATGLKMIGLYGLLDRHSKGAPLKGRLMRAYLWAVAATIGGGTSEIQRNIIATRGLGLPRD